MVTQSGRKIQSTSPPDRTSAIFGVPGSKSSPSKSEAATMSRKNWTLVQQLSWSNDDEPAAMSGALSSGRTRGGSGEWGGGSKNKEKIADGNNIKKGKKKSKNKGAGTGVASAYYKDVGKKGIKKRKHQVYDSDLSDGGGGGGGSGGFDVPLTKDEKKRRKERQMRFQASEIASKVQAPSAEDAVFAALSAPRGDGSSSTKNKKRKGTKSVNFNGVSEENGFIGTSQSLEKPYLRLTTFPKAEDVRPLPVLKRALEHIKRRYHTEEDFSWANEQLKSVRQDLTVQGLRNEFVLEVYVTHARLALEEGELNEFNQCQTKIKELTIGTGGGDTNASTDDGIDVASSTKKKKKSKIAKKLLKQDADSADEFAGYRLLYALVQKNWADVNKELACVSAMTDAEHRRVEEEKQRDDRLSSCRHATLVTKAVIHCDYHDFFVLYENAPHMSCYLMDFLVKRIRCGAYERIISAFRPTISVEYFRETLRFRDLEETRQFLKQSGAVFVKESGGDPPFYVDCKESKSLCR